MKKNDFDSIYDGCKEIVWRLVSRYVFTQEDREDLFQEVFLSVHRALPKFRGDSSASTWIYKIAVNTSINHVKSRNRFRWLVNTLGNMRQQDQDPADAADDIKDLAPLKKLNPQQRMVLLLSDVEERKLEEIAGMMKMPLGTVKSTLHRAREIVRKEVESEKWKVERGGGE